MHSPGKGHWQAVKWILRYLRGTLDVGLKYERMETMDQYVIGYADSDYAGDLDKRRSTSGYIFTLARGPVSWRSTLQSTVALSTTEAEYMALTEAAKEAVWLRNLVGDFGIVQRQVTIFCDSQSAICLTKNPVHHNSMKHVRVKFNYVRERVEEGDIIVTKVDTEDNQADMLTKIVTGIKFNHCLSLINVSLI